VFLPANASRVEEETVHPARQHTHPGHEKILLVEDDADVRKFVHDILQDAGYEVQDAANGIEALKVWKANHSEFDLLLTDMVMPHGLNGGKLAEHLRQEQPDLKVIFMSGYNPEIAGRNRPSGCFLQKPCSMETLTETVQSLLPQRAPARARAWQ